MKDLTTSIGKTILARVSGIKLDQKLKTALNKGVVGGVVLFQDNVQSQEQLFNLIQDIYKNSHHYPIIACDQEGGAVDRFFEVLTPIPSAMSLSAACDPEAFAKVIDVVLSELCQIGINCILAPVLDVVTSILNPIIGTRAYSDDPDTVCHYAGKYLEIARKYNILTVVKHFPGHGSTVEDSHLDLAVNPHNIGELLKTDLYPYTKLASLADGIMMAHVWTVAIDPQKKPASISKAVYDYLLYKLNFNGIIFTDDMAMGAIKQNYGINEACFEAFKAGANYLMLCDDIDTVCAVNSYLNIKIAFSQELIEMLDKSLTKIETCFKPNRQSAFSLINSNTLQKHYQINLDSAKSGLCLVKGELVDLQSIDFLYIPTHHRYNFNLDDMVKQFKTYSFKTEFYKCDLNNSTLKKLTRLSSNQNILLVLYRPILNQNQLKLVNNIQDLCKNLYIIVVDVPFGIEKFTGANMVLCCLDPSRLAMQALAEVLVKQELIHGKLPLMLSLH